MSTKIYQAFRFKKEFEDLTPFLIQVRSEVIEKLKDFYIKNYRNRLLENKNNFFTYVKILEDATEKNFWQFNIGSSVCVFFNRGKIYLQFYLPGDFGHLYSSINSELFDSWSEYIEDYHYQNQTDMPDNISESDWDERRDIWDEILEVDVRPSYAGYVWTILEKTDSFIFLSDVYKQFT